MDHSYYLWMSYGATALAIVVELALLRAGRGRARRAIDAERELEAQD
jgi:heme exporter protein CcmD